MGRKNLVFAMLDFREKNSWMCSGSDEDDECEKGLSEEEEEAGR